MAFTDQLGQAVTGLAATLSNIELGIGASINPSTNAPLFIGILQNRFLTGKVVQRATSQLDTQPKNYDIAVTETAFPHIIDVTNYTGGNDVVSGLSAVLTLTSTGAVITPVTPNGWQVSLTNSGNTVTTVINGSKLRVGQIYQLAVTFTLSSSKVATYFSTLTVAG